MKPRKMDGRWRSISNYISIPKSLGGNTICRPTVGPIIRVRTPASVIEFLPGLPFHLTVERIYADFLRYLLAHTRTFFGDRTSNGKNIWLNLIYSADFVIAHPNGWGSKEQSVLRRAAIQADLVRPSDAEARVHFVTEAEASVHFCVANAHLAARLKVRAIFFA